MERKPITCPETAHLEQIDLEHTSDGIVISGCSRFNPPDSIDCARECARRLDKRERVVRDEHLIERLATLATRAPRYTSYPPATSFAPVGPATVERELAQLREARTPIALYVHVPFCRSLCAYCGCNVIPTRDGSRGDAYVDQVVTELAMLSERLGEHYPVAEIALGGGSPNFLSPSAMRILLAAINRYFDVAPDARKSVELDPRTTTSSQLEVFAALGFRSMSVGVQDFDERVQQAIRRHQTALQTKWLIDRARADQFNDVNVDIVYGLPHQTEDSLRQTLDTVISLAPDRIALFGYAHLPSKLPHQRIVERSGRIADAYERATMFVLATEHLKKAGYIHLGLDHFAKPDSALARAASEHRMTRSFQGYVEHKADTILGVGVSSISSTPTAFWQNHVELDDWRDAVQRAQFPVARGLVLDRDDQIRRAVIEALMCEGEVSLTAIGARFDIDARTYFARELEQLATLDELAHVDTDAPIVHTTPLGRYLVRNVCALFDRHLAGSEAGGAKFSSTI